MRKQMHFAFDLDWIHQEGRWRMPGSWTGRNYPALDVFKEIASIAERGCIDMLFFGDKAGIPNTWRSSTDAAVKWGTGFPRQDMSPYIAALSQVTKNIGFGLTYSSTYLPPYYVARMLNSLDHITNGRMAFNVVTSSNKGGAANFGFDELMEHNSRYERMEEFVDVCKALWDSVAPDAMLWDAESGIVADPEKVEAINHSGKFFKVKGPLQCAPSPQGRPILIQAGGSPRGIRASAKFADFVFGGEKPLKRKVQHRAELDDALLANNRNPDDVGVLWSIILVVDETRSEAVRRKEQYLTMLPMEAVGAFVSGSCGYDFSTLPERFKLNDLNQAIVDAQASPVGFVFRMANEVGGDTEVTRKEFFERARMSATGYDHTLAGTAAELADHLEEEFEATGSRGGFMPACPLSTPRDLLAIVDLLIPELQRRGRFRTQYRGRTLRENLRLQ